MVECEDECGVILKFDEPRDGTVYVRMEQPKIEARWCTMYLDANGIVELIVELQGILKKLGEGSGGEK